MKKLILGSAQFGLDYGINNSKGKFNCLEVEELLDYAHSKGVQTLDTAQEYGDAEITIGEYFKKHPKNKFKIITKITLQNKSFEEALKKSLKRLQLDQVEVIMFHSFEEYKRIKNELPNWVAKFKGVLFKKIGVSLYTNEEIETVLGDVNIDVIQTPFNLLDNEFQRGEQYKKIKRSGKELHVRSVFLQGLFFKPLDQITKQLQPLVPLLKELQLQAAKSKISLNEIALAYVQSKPYVDGFLIGVDDLDQLKSNLSATQIKLSDQIVNTIDQIALIEKNVLNPGLWKR